MAAVVPPELRDVALRVERETFRWLVVVVGEFRLHENAELVGGVKILRQLAVRVKPHKVESRPSRLGEMLTVDVAIGGRETSQRVDAVVAESAEKERPTVQAELPAADLDLTDAKPLEARMRDRASAHKLYAPRVEVRMLGRPRAEILERQADDGLPVTCRHDGYGSFNAETHVALVASFESAHLHMRLRRSRVEISAHPRVVDVGLRRRLQLDVAIDAAPAVDVAHQPLARRHQVAHLRSYLRRPSWRHVIRYLVLIRATVVVYERHRRPVDVEASVGLDASDLEPDAAAAPCGGYLDLPAVLADAHEQVSYRLGTVVSDNVPPA